ncbi:MAG: DUF3575 domain-containing protein [Bacteroidales bacterium]|nr:DUF3575 domain-containing protein [Bacteroidales bacterium]MBO7487844.1 DUF3575 domain-containing protein [Bacteroidales bacterium]
MKRTGVIALSAVLILLCTTSVESFAQRWSIGTNIVDYLNLGTLNVESSVAVARHYSFNAGVRFNPWTFHYGSEDRQFENRKRCCYAGVRYWPWHIYSGWWTGLQLQYQEYNRGGLSGRHTEEGDAYGLGLSLGYTLMVHKSFNIEFGVGGWAGLTAYTAYSCPYCGEILDQGNKFFVWPNNVMVSLVYIL